jgi:hypothetical protein
MAAAAWVFMGIWLGMVALFTWLFVREGGMGQFGYDAEAAILGLFWLAGIAAAGYFANIPVISVDRAGDRAIVTERRLFRRTIRDVGISELGGVVVREDTDGEGDPYFRAVLSLPDGREVVVAERHDRATVNGAAVRVRAALQPDARVTA